MRPTKLLIATAVSFALAATVQAAAKDGTYEGTANGKNGPLTVQVVIKNSKIASVKVLKSGETAMVSDAAMERVPAEIVKTQSLRVDNVAGATLTSMAIQAAATNAVKAAGGQPSEYYKKPVKKQPSGMEVTYKTDVVVVGSGASGMAAAVRAQLNGLPTILIEKMPTLGGDTILNAGTLIATGSRYQKEVMKEMKDSPELAFKDIMKVGKNKNDPVLVNMVTHKVGGVVDWLIDDLKIPYGPAATQYPDHSAERQLGVQGRSPNFIKTMASILTDHGGKILMETKATKLIYKDHRVRGVEAVNAAGDEIKIYAKDTILASGGFGANTKMLPPTLKGFLFYGLDSDAGQGYEMARKVGAKDINMDLVKVYPQGVETTPNHGLAATASSTATINDTGAIYVNSDGKRIINERASLGELTDITVAQKDKIMYLVMDANGYKRYLSKSLEDKLVPDEAELRKWLKIVNNGKPVMVESDSLAKAADVMGINAKNLEATVAEWNKMAEAGKDTQFGRKDPKELIKAPYYIVEQKPRFATTLGGLKANAKMQIIGKNGKPIPGLYGAGCVVGGANGADSMTAMMNSWAIISGVEAADAITASLKKNK
uniref:FAD-binding protein n=1 Tax=Turicimonas muris TaxID=1796652 RepID=UPI00402A6F36